MRRFFALLGPVIMILLAISGSTFIAGISMSAV
jgi:hypothetical protein